MLRHMGHRLSVVFCRHLILAAVLLGGSSAVATPSQSIFNMLLSQCPATVASIVSQNNFVVTEANTTVNISVNLSKPACADIPIYYGAYTDGVQGTHYSGSLNGSITIAKGATAGTITINLSQNALAEIEKKIYISLQGTTQSKQKVQLGVLNTALVQITDDDSTYGTITQAGTGGSYACAIKSSGALTCWGSNYSGQLGDGTTVDKTTPIITDSGVNYSQISTAQSHMCGITTAGVLKCWGSGFGGKLGTGNTADKKSPTVIDAGVSYSQVSGGDRATCGITTTGQMKCWGENNSGEIGDGTNTARYSPTVVDVGVTYQKVSVNGVNGGGNFVCAITTANKLRCWGRNTDGQLGINSIVNQNLPVDVDASESYTHISNGTVHACGITTTGVLKCWGGNAYGQLGDGTAVTSKTPKVIDVGVSYIHVSAAGEFTCGVTSTNKLKCWGRNVQGELGIGSTVMSRVPVEVDAANTYSKVYAGGGHLNGPNPSACGLRVNGQLYCWGSNNGQLANGFPIAIGTQVYIDAGTQYSKVCVGGSNTCGITTAGILKCWGVNNKGQVGDGTNDTRYSPVIIDAGVTYKEISISASTQTSSRDSHACGITTAGVLKCWGNNASYRLGDGTTTNKNKPVVIDSGVTYSKVSVGHASSCAITATGELKCWGLNNSGQLGDGTATTRTLPKVIDAGTTYSAVATSEGYNTGKAHTCGITTAGVLKCWGDNSHGQLGNGSTSNSSVPVVVDAGVTYSKISVGAAFLWGFTCGITTGGELKCWGGNGHGGLGDGTTVQKNSPVLIDSGTSYLDISLKGEQSCAITSANVLKCWGYNFYGQVGDGTTTNRTTPVVIDAATGYTSVSNGHFAWSGSNSCGITTDGLLRCWNKNVSGSMGIPSSDMFPNLIPKIHQTP